MHWQNNITQHQESIAETLAKMAHFIHPRIVQRVQKWNEVQREWFFGFKQWIDMEYYLGADSACVFPGYRRPSNKDTGGKKFKFDENIRAILDDNIMPRNIWTYLAYNMGYSGGPNGTWARRVGDNSALNEFEITHLLPHKDDDENLALVREVFSQTAQTLKPYGNFTAAGNVVLLPKGSVKPTDRLDFVKKVLYCRYIELYGESSLVGYGISQFNPSDDLKNFASNLEWKNPVLPENWEIEIDNLISYRVKHLTERFQGLHDVPLLKDAPDVI